MTTGSIWKHILSFAFPLMIGNLFQQLYNTVDSVVVGNFVGKEALAAVGSTGPIMNTLIGFFMGLSAGAGIAVSQAYGAKDEKRVHDAVHAALFLTMILAVVFTAVGVAFVPGMLQLMSTPEYEEYTIWMAEARMNGVLRMDREEIIATVERHLDRYGSLRAMLDYIEDSPFREEIWESIESKDLRDAADVLEYMGA